MGMYIQWINKSRSSDNIFTNISVIVQIQHEQISNGKSKGKVHPRTGHKGPEGE